MTMKGMDTLAGRQAGEAIDSGAAEITALAARMDTLLKGFDWTGKDALRTVDTWDHQSRPHLDQTATHLRSLAVLLRKEAEAQDLTSGQGAIAPVVQRTAPPAPQAKGWLQRRIDAFSAAIARWTQTDNRFTRHILELLQGKDVPVATIAADILLATGQTLGAVVNAVTGEDHRIFAEGPGSIGTPIAVSNPIQPRSLPDLMQGVTDSYNDPAGPDGSVRILTINNANGQRAFVVDIAGTERWWPHATGASRDLTANLALVSHGPTAVAEAVRKAMDAAGIPSGAPVMLIGHSQGGMVGAGLTADPAFMARYNVTHLATYGSPIDYVDIPPSVQVLPLQHVGDWVPHADLEDEPTLFGERNHYPTVTLPRASETPWGSHNHELYMQSVRNALASDSPQGGQIRNFQRGLDDFLVGDGESASAVDVPIRRDPPKA